MFDRGSPRGDEYGLSIATAPYIAEDPTHVQSAIHYGCNGKVAWAEGTYPARKAQACERRATHILGGPSTTTNSWRDEKLPTARNVDEQVGSMGFHEPTHREKPSMSDE